MKGELAEKKVFDYIISHLDSKAILLGGMDSTQPDIILSNGEIVEVKQNEAQCGQFTLATSNSYSYSQDIITAFGESPTNNQILSNSELCSKWIKDYYIQKKKVSLFGIYFPKEDKVELLTPEEFFQKAIFKCTYRCKKSGTSSSTPKWVYPLLPKEWMCEEEGKYMIAHNKASYDKSIKALNTKGTEVQIWVNPEGKVKIKSNTCNPTYIFSLEIK